MSAEHDHRSTDAISAAAAFWTQWMEQSARGTQALLGLIATSSDPATLQRRWLETLAEQFDSFMRTPAFMEMMRRNLKSITDLKVAQDQAVHGAARQLGLPLADDIAGLFERLHSTEQEIVSRLEAIERRLDDLEPAHPKSTNGAAKAAAAPPRARARKSAR